MRVFKKPNLNHKWECPICGTNEEKEIVLVSIDGTQKDNISEALQIHLECIELTYYKPPFDEYELLAQKFEKRK